MTHKEAIPTVKSHLPIWEGITNELFFISPIDSQMNIKGIKEIAIGEAEHHGEKSAQRIIQIFEFALRLNWEYILLMEYDSFALEVAEIDLPDESGVSAPVYLQNNHKKFTAKFSLHYPMLFTRDGFGKTYNYLNKVVDCNDRYYSDRFIGKAVEISQIPVKNLFSINRAFTRNTITKDYEPALQRAIKAGAKFFHGVKSSYIKKIILEGVKNGNELLY